MKPGKERQPLAASEVPASPGISGLAGLAFGNLSGRLQHFLLRRLRSRENAEDLAQEVYLRLLRFGDIELIKSPEAYVYQVAFNVLCEFKLRERRAVVTFDSEAASEAADALPPDSVSPEEVLDRQICRRELDTVLGRLPPMQRAVFLLAARYEMPHAEIAEKLGISMHTVRKYLYRAIHYCRQQLPGM